MANSNLEISKDKSSEQSTPNDIVAAQAGQKSLQNASSDLNLSINEATGLSSATQETYPVTAQQLQQSSRLRHLSMVTAQVT